MVGDFFFIDDVVIVEWVGYDVSFVEGLVGNVKFMVKCDIDFVDERFRCIMIVDVCCGNGYDVY